MDERLQAVLQDLRRVQELSTADRNRCARRAAWLADAEIADQCEFLAALRELPLPLDDVQEILLKAALAAFAQRRCQNPSAEQQPAVEPDAALRSAVANLYRHLGPHSAARGPLLAWLASGGSRADLAQLTELLVDDPPSDDADVVQAIAPLFRRRDLPVEALFPRLLDALGHPPLAAAVIDLANFLFRQHLASEHPASQRRAELMSTLGSLVGKLGQLEESPQSLGDSPRDISRRVQQSVALAVSLCDALALLGDKAAIARLYPALALGHRRLKTEAAAALARLGEERGQQELIGLAAEPVARLRALAYADELGIGQQIDPQYRTPQARAEAELTVWLAEPTQFGIPPQACELIDHRRQFWPGFSEPVDCFLFRFTYALTVEDQERTYTSIGIAGPMAHAFTADLADLPPQDIYAAFAGWQAEHEEIKEYDVEKLSRSGQTEVARLTRRLHDAGYEQIEPRLLGDFFGDRSLMAACVQGTLPGVAVVDPQDILFFPARNPRRPIGVREAYSIYKGRKLLKSFNPQET